MPSHRTTAWTRLSSRTTRSLTLAAAAAGAFGVPALASAATASAPAPAVASAHAPAAAIQAAVAAAKPAAQSVALGAPAAGHANTLTVAPAAAAPAPQSYHVVHGDTLFGIAKQYLGNGDRYHEIFDANQGKQQAKGGSLTNPDLIMPGWDLQIPNGAAKAATPSSTTTHTQTQQGAAKQSTNVSKPATPAPAKAATTPAPQAAAATTTYANNLDGWIKEAQAILAAHGYKVSYNAIYQTVMHESGGNPKAVNGWDSNAAAGHPSIGLMQTIQPTFNAFALPGHTDIYNPVDNIIAGARYAASRYGSLDNVVAARCGGSCWFGY